MPLEKGIFAKVDDDDYANLLQYKWFIAGRYVRRCLPMTNKQQPQVPMHYDIFRRKIGFQIDHINGDKLDNRKSNLRYCTSDENSWNKKITKSNTSGYKGVSPVYRRWRVLIYVHGRRIHLGQYKNPIVAAKVYDRKARELFGEFANTNFKEDYG